MKNKPSRHTIYKDIKDFKKKYSPIDPKNILEINNQ